jgi:alkylhydroperoxidase family enzyme
MARVSYVEPRSAPAQVKEVYDRVLKGKPGNIQKALAHRPEILEAFLPFYASIGKSIEKRLYELLYIRVSMVNGCEY